MKNRERQRGMAMVEVALIMIFVLVPLTLCIIEGGSALSDYTALNEASRAAARRVVVSGDTEDVDDLIRSVAGSLDPDALSAQVTMDKDNGLVTVEVAYAHQWLLGTLAQYSGYDDLTFSASTTMPLP